MAFCPPVGSSEFKELEEIFGERLAYLLWHKNGGHPLELDSDGSPSKLYEDIKANKMVKTREQALRIKGRSFFIKRKINEENSTDKLVGNMAPKGTINVYWGQSESTVSTKVLSNLAQRKFTYQGKEYGSVEMAYQTLKSGEFDQNTYDAYNKIDFSPF